MTAIPNRPKSHSAELAEMRRLIDQLVRRIAVPVVPQVSADPTSPVNGQIWIRSDTNQLCYFVNGTVKRITGT